MLTFSGSVQRTKCHQKVCMKHRFEDAYDCVASAVDYPWMELCDPLLRDRRWGNTALRGCSQGALYGRGLQQVEEGPAQENAIDAASSFLRGIRLLDFCCECDLSQCVSFLVKHCVARKPLSFYESGTALAEDMGMPVSKMWESIDAQIQTSLKTAQDLSVDLNDFVNDFQVNSLQYCSDQDEIHATVSKSFIRVTCRLSDHHAVRSA